jgi:hypothetical protein
LHKHFVLRNRPVPHFLILDQPFQVYFPSRQDYLQLDGVEIPENTNADMVAVENLFDVLYKATEELHPHFQLIILEHANLDEARFQDSLIEKPWRRGHRALIPTSWLRDTEDK